ncbi:hypothetical protein CEXT_51121 [Caerostris extrusa]|uniref:Uncharacterized protein n=1 Tax=Caerostris extrusa TaxID=172846 RepID=A0AAV4N2M0_CAEEX|nr:hypothetical protein CEXT_51121 [Caerostris extrusa]
MDKKEIFFSKYKDIKNRGSGPGSSLLTRPSTFLKTLDSTDNDFFHSTGGTNRCWAWAIINSDISKYSNFAGTKGPHRDCSANLKDRPDNVHLIVVDFADCRFTAPIVERTYSFLTATFS